MAEQEKIQLNEVIGKVHEKLDGTQNDIDAYCKTLENKEIRAKNTESRDYFIFESRPLWDLWCQKLFAQIISVKIWIITLITVLLVTKHITNIQFAAILGTVMAFKGAFAVADVWKRNGTNGNMIDKV